MQEDKIEVPSKHAMKVTFIYSTFQYNELIYNNIGHRSWDVYIDTSVLKINFLFLSMPPRYC